MQTFTTEKKQTHISLCVCVCVEPEVNILHQWLQHLITVLITVHLSAPHCPQEVRH